MAKTIDLKKDERVLREQQAAQSLRDQGVNPTQRDIYKQAYGSPYVVFSEDYETPRLKEELKGLVSGEAGVEEALSQALTKPKREAKYAKNVRRSLKGFNDPLARQSLMNQILGKREAARQDTVGKARDIFGQKIAGVESLLGEALQREQQAMAEETGLEQSAAEEALYQQRRAEKLQDLMKELQVRQQFKSSGGGSSYAGYTNIIQDDLGNVYGVNKRTGESGLITSLPQPITSMPTYDQWLGQNLSSIEAERGLTDTSYNVEDIYNDPSVVGKYQEELRAMETTDDLFSILNGLGVNAQTNQSLGNNNPFFSGDPFYQED